MGYNKDVRLRYQSKLKQFKVQYNLQDNIEGLRVQKYLDQTGQSANSYIKSLLKKDMDEKGIIIDQDDQDQEAEADAEAKTDI